MKNQLLVELEAFTGTAVAVLVFDENGFAERREITPEPAADVMGKMRLAAGGELEKFNPTPAPKGARKRARQ